MSDIVLKSKLITVEPCILEIKSNVNAQEEGHRLDTRRKMGNNVDEINEDDKTKDLGKKWKRERKEALRKTGLCKHFGQSGGCPFEKCSFAHGLDEIRDGGEISLTAQRKRIRLQVVERKQNNLKTSKTGEGMVDRYYQRMFKTDVMGMEKEDQFVNFHSNRLCVIGIAPRHPLIACKPKITSISFEVGKNGTNLLEKKVHGKKKKGGMWLNPDTAICSVKCSNGKEYTLRSNIRGSLLELNDNLLANPSLLQESPCDRGYVAIVRPKVVEIAEIQDSLLGLEEYHAIVAEEIQEKSA